MIYYFAIYDILLHERMFLNAEEECPCIIGSGEWRFSFPYFIPGLGQSLYFKSMRCRLQMLKKRGEWWGM
jgi:hypothetical protein